MNCQQLANWLHQWGLSDAKIAKHTGVTRVYVNYIRHGKKRGSTQLQSNLNELKSIAMDIDREDNEKRVVSKKVSQPKQSSPEIVWLGMAKSPYAYVPTFTGVEDIT